MPLIPLPSHVHYELLLQLLERQTLHSLGPTSPQYEQVREVITNLRKALVQQKQLEEHFARAGLQIEHRWSLNEMSK